MSALQAFDLSGLGWRLSGCHPLEWLRRPREEGISSAMAVDNVPFAFPGSVQRALRDAGIIPDWRVGLNAPLCEWVENRHWQLEARLPAEWIPAPGSDARLRLHFTGLDGPGWLLFDNGEPVRFDNTHVPVTLDLTAWHTGRSGPPPDEGPVLRVVFDSPPRWQGYLGHTSRMFDFKPRYYYTWDWQSRVVQLGVHGPARLEVIRGPILENCRCRTEYCPATRGGRVVFHARLDPLEEAYTRPLRVRLAVASEGADGPIAAVEVPVGALEDGAALEVPRVDPWWPNGMGARPLYEVTAELLDRESAVLSRWKRRTGFRAVEWRRCEGASAAATPWICVVNGAPLFLQGVNWTPLRETFADLRDEDYDAPLAAWADRGVNVLRVWGGATLEREAFYRRCDELGIFVWQDFPLSSSGLENWPPEDPAFGEEMARLARSYIKRRQHHPSLLLWCGGNELQGDREGRPQGAGRPCTKRHPLLARLGEIVAAMDPGRRFLPATASGPRFTAAAENFGRGEHWDVHGPWKMSNVRHEGGMAAWEDYWMRDDALFRSEAGMPGFAPEALIRRYAGELDPWPADMANPLWKRVSWWVQWDEFQREEGRAPVSLAEMAAWSQARQARALEIAFAACKRRFPRCGGFIVWMGHDTFPCFSNTSLVDCEGAPKPAAEAFRHIALTPPERIPAPNRASIA